MKVNKQTNSNKTFIHCVFFSNVSLNVLLEKSHSQIGCICLAFLRCVFSNVSSNHLFENIQNHIGCICWYCVFSNVYQTGIFPREMLRWYGLFPREMLSWYGNLLTWDSSHCLAADLSRILAPIVRTPRAFRSWSGRAGICLTSISWSEKSSTRCSN